MFRVLLLMLVLCTAAAADSGSPFGTASGDGLSGYPYLPSSDVLADGVLRLQGMFQYMDTDGGSYLLRLPLSVGYGWFENVEVGATIPLYLRDETWDGSILGSLSVAGAWKYETARGGSALRLSGGLTLPTGAEYRDPEAEVFLGAATSTTFRLFRLSARARYIVDTERDRMHFTLGAASFVTGDLVVHGSMTGTTVGELDLSGGVVTSPWDRLSLMATVTVGLEGVYDFLISAGVAWTGLSL